MNCIHRRECVDEKEHEFRTRNDFWWLGFAGGLAVGMLIVVVINVLVFGYGH